MLDFEKLAAAMGELDEDTMKELLEAVMAEGGVKIVALSGVLTLAIDSMKATVEAVRAAVPECKVIIGGAPVSEGAKAITGADEWAHSPQKTVTVCKEWAQA